MKKHLLAKTAFFLTLLLTQSYSLGEETTSKERAFQRNEKIEQLRQSIESPESALQASLTAEAVNIVFLDPSFTEEPDAFGDIKVLGELRNDGDTIASFVDITFTFKNASDAVIGTETTFVFGSSRRLTASGIVTDTILHPGEVGGFKLYTTVPYDQVASMTYQIGFDVYDTQPMEGSVVLYGSLTMRDDGFGDLELLGELQNTGAITVYFVQFVATIKNAAGRVIDVAFTYVDGATITLGSGVTTDTALAAGAVGSFDLYTLAAYAEVDSISYKINWDEEAPVVEEETETEYIPPPPSDDDGGGGGCFIGAMN